MKTYVLIISETFPSHHPKAGYNTDFCKQISEGYKLHTIRKNWKLWKRRIEEVNRGEAVVSMRVWTGRPYHSKQKEVRKFRQNEIGFEKLYHENGYHVVGLRDVALEQLAINDGLTIDDFINWFKKFPEDPAAIIHFTGFRYY